QDVQCGLVGRDVPVRPEDLVDRGLKAQVGPAGELGDRVPGAQLVGAGADPGVHDAVGQGAAGALGELVAAGVPQVQPAVGGGQEPAGLAQRACARVVGGGPG